MIAQTSNELCLGTGNDGKKEKKGKGGKNKVPVTASQLPASTAAAINEESNQKSEHINAGSRFLAKLSKLFKTSPAQL